MTQTGCLAVPRSGKVSLALLVALVCGSGCAPDYSPNTYSSNAVQLANKVESGTVVGYREVVISANGNVGAVTGGAAGGLLGAQYGNSALAAIGGSAVGSMVGNTLDHATGDTTGWEYIIRKGNGDMLSVTQREPQPLALGQKVLVIIGPQARVVPDYSVAADPPPPPKEKAETKPESNVKVEVVLSLPPGVSAEARHGQIVVAPAPETAAPSAVSALAPKEPVPSDSSVPAEPPSADTPAATLPEPSPATPSDLAGSPTSGDPATPAGERAERPASP